MIDDSFVEADVDGDRRHHPIAGERQADPGTKEEFIGFGRFGFIARSAHAVTEGLDLIDEAIDLEIRRDEELGAAEGRIDLEVASFVAREDRFDEPDARAAVNTLEIERDALSAFAGFELLLDGSEPFAIARSGGKLADGHTRSAPQVVITIERSCADQGRDRLTASTAIFVSPPLRDRLGAVRTICISPPRILEDGELIHAHRALLRFESGDAKSRGFLPRLLARALAPAAFGCGNLPHHVLRHVPLGAGEG